MQQSQHKQSPRPKGKSSQAVSTPIGKKSVEYAGPSFNHSPAPANLPPPPFLSKSLPQRSSSSFGGRVSPPVGASPLSFLFDAKQKEEELRDLGGSRPPSLNYQATTRRSELSGLAVQSRHALVDLEGEENDSSIESRADTKSRPSSKIPYNTSPAPRKSPWAAVEKPKSIDLLDPTSQMDQVSAPRSVRQKATISSSPAAVKREGLDRVASAEQISTHSTKTNTKGKKVNVETPRKRKNPKNGTTTENTTPKQSTPVTPKMILKRDPNDSPAAPRTSQTESRSTRVAASPSTFKPLKKVPAAAAASPVRVEGQTEEEDLRQQAANLMAILQLKPSSSTNQEGSAHGTSQNEGPKNNESSFESDLRRMLQLGV